MDFLILGVMLVHIALPYAVKAYQEHTRPKWIMGPVERKPKTFLFNTQTGGYKLPTP